MEKYLAESLEVEFKKSLNQALKNIQSLEKKTTQELEPLERREEIDFIPIETSVPKEDLQEATEKFCRIPEGFNLHPKLIGLVKERLAMVKEGPESKPVDWGMAETLAYASLLLEGFSVRFSGQDSCRGTFSHRHAMWKDQVEERSYYPLKHLSPQQGRFDILIHPYLNMPFWDLNMAIARLILKLS